jgi:hypothetical protein
MLNLAQKKLDSQNNTLNLRQEPKTNPQYNDASFNNSNNNPYTQNQAGRMK